MNAINEEHREIEALLPWYAAGTLSRPEHLRLLQDPKWGTLFDSGFHCDRAGTVPLAMLAVFLEAKLALTLVLLGAVEKTYEAGEPSERPQFRFLSQHHLPGLTQINEPRGISVYAFSMEATEPNERLAGASNTEHRKCPL